MHHWLLGAGVFVAAYLNRVGLSFVAGWGVVGDRRALRSAWLYPLRDFMGFAFWCASYTSRTIVWRGDWYRLEGCGRMVLLQPTEPALEHTLAKPEVGVAPVVADRFS